MKSSYLLIMTIVILSLAILPETVQSEYFRAKFKRFKQKVKDTKAYKKISKGWKYVWDKPNNNLQNQLGSPNQDDIPQADDDSDEPKRESITQKQKNKLPTRLRNLFKRKKPKKKQLDKDSKSNDNDSQSGDNEELLEQIRDQENLDSDDESQDMRRKGLVRQKNSTANSTWVKIKKKIKYIYWGPKGRQLDEDGQLESHLSKIQYQQEEGGVHIFGT